MLNRESILAAHDLHVLPVEMPEWGGTVNVRAMSALDRDAWEVENMQGGGGKIDYRNFRARFVVRHICDEQGNRLLTDDDADILGKKNAAALDRLFDVCRKLSGVTEKDVEEIRKN